MKNDLKKGQIIVLFVLFLSVAMPITGLVVDYGFIELNRTRMQNAVDAATLSATYRLNTGDENDAWVEADAVLDDHGYGTSHGDTVVGTLNPDGTHPNRYRVALTRTINTFFGPFIGVDSMKISVFATGQMNSYVELSITLAGQYGQDDPEALIGLKGKYAAYAHGDPYSTVKGPGGGPNPDYDPEGYNFFVYIPKPSEDYVAINGTNICDVEIWDPESYGEFDESTGMKTEYRLYAPDTTPTDFSDDVQIAYFKEFSDPSTNAKWNNWQDLVAVGGTDAYGFRVDTSATGFGRYRLNVRTTAGSRGQGFHLRAGPPLARDGDGNYIEPFNPNNGTAISADGNLPIWFRIDYNTSLDITLGYVPGTVAGNAIHVMRFDSDCGAKSVSYWNEADGAGTLYPLGSAPIPITSADASVWVEDIIDLDLSYTGTTWHATYDSGGFDQTVWRMWYEGMTDATSGFGFLVE